MDDYSSDATIYAAPTDVPSGAVSAARPAFSTLSSRKARGSNYPAPERMKSSEISVSNKAFPADTFAPGEVSLHTPSLAHASTEGRVSSELASAAKSQEPWRECILLVEDETDIRNLLSHTLTSWGYGVQLAANGEEALRLLREANATQRAELILTDIQMPGLNGLELLRQVRSDDPDMPVIVMTAFSSNQALTRALRLHANDFVAKPIEIPELQTALDRALSARRQREELNSERTRAARLQAVLETATAVNHEINNPLASISASAQLLRYHIDKHNLQISSTASNVPIEEMDVEAVSRLLDVILEQCDRIADFNRKLTGVVNPVTRSSGGHRMLDVDSSR
jgi:CheY-like chemotaxis protein